MVYHKYTIFLINGQVVEVTASEYSFSSNTNAPQLLKFYSGAIIIATFVVQNISGFLRDGVVEESIPDNLPM